jgi:hypothetical protein
VDKLAVPKTHQSSAKKFGQTLLAVGKGAIISKMDMRDAFKLVPARIEDLRLQGFRWLNNYFINTQQICGELNVPLADDCLKREKAFTNETNRTVLGVEFDTDTLSWRLADQKIRKIQNSINDIFVAGHADLKQVERLVGRLNNFGQMMPLLSTFRRPMNEFLAPFKEDYEILLPVPNDLKSDLEVWYNVVTESHNWLPIL